MHILDALANQLRLLFSKSLRDQVLKRQPECINQRHFRGNILNFSDLWGQKFRRPVTGLDHSRDEMRHARRAGMIRHNFHMPYDTGAPVARTIHDVCDDIDRDR